MEPARTSIPPPRAAGSTAAGDIGYGRPARRRVTPWVLGAALLTTAVLAGLWLATHATIHRARVIGVSMEPTLAAGQSLSVEDGIALHVGNIVILHPPKTAGTPMQACGVSDEGAGTTAPCGAPEPAASRGTFVKRIVAGPGDRVALIDGQVILNGVRHDAPSGLGCNDTSSCDFPTAVTVPAGDYFVLGDNRDVSDDSRFWGPVPASWIVGTVVHCGVLNTSCAPIH